MSCSHQSLYCEALLLSSLISLNLCKGAKKQSKHLGYFANIIPNMRIICSNVLDVFWDTSSYQNNFMQTTETLHIAGIELHFQSSSKSKNIDK